MSRNTEYRSSTDTIAGHVSLIPFVNKHNVINQSVNDCKQLLDDSPDRFYCPTPQTGNVLDHGDSLESKIHHAMNPNS